MFAAFRRWTDAEPEEFGGEWSDGVRLARLDPLVPGDGVGPYR